MYLFVYKTSHENGRYYIGRHQSKNLDDGYIGSGKWVKSIKDKSKLTRDIIAETDSLSSLIELERHYIEVHYDDPLCMNYLQGSAGWSSKDQSGKNNQKYNPTIHHFIHLDGREEHLTMYDMRRKHPEINQSRLSTMISNGFGSVKGWRLFGTDIPLIGQTDPNIYHFIHKDGNELVCDRQELMNRYPHIDSANIGRMIKGKSKSAYGWKLSVV